MRINQLPAAQSVDATDVVAVDTENGTKRVPKSTWFNGYYTAAEVDAAIAQSTANKAKSAYLNWGKTLTATDYHHGLLLVGRDAAYIVWFASTSDINIRSLRTDSVTKAASDTITFGNDSADGTDYTITRSGTTITVTSTNNVTISLIYN